MYEFLFIPNVWEHNASFTMDKVKEVTLLSLIKRVNNTQG